MLAQIPGTETAIDAAAHRGYEAILMCIVVVMCIALVGILFRWFIQSMDKRAEEAVKREEALSKRINELEQFVQTQLMAMMSKNNDVINNLTLALQGRPCLLERDNHGGWRSKMGEEGK